MQKQTYFTVGISTCSTGVSNNINGGSVPVSQYAMAVNLAHLNGMQQKMLSITPALSLLRHVRMTACKGRSVDEQKAVVIVD